LPNLTCETCGRAFFQGRGRPARRCPACRDEDRYGPAHVAMRAATVAQAVGQLCVRCGLPMLPGQEVQLDHADDGSGRYLGYSHKRCNLSAGASRGNRMRAAAYRAAKGLPAPLNGARAYAPSAVEQPNCQRSREEIRASADPLPCVCGRKTSRCW
jgi:hypothetical protein